jgi:hypothetical protein
MLVEHVMGNGEQVRLGAANRFVPRHAQQAQVHFLDQIRDIDDGISQPRRQISLQPLSVLGGERRYEGLSIIGWQAESASELPLLY